MYAVLIGSSQKDNHMKLARWIFLVAGILGLLMVAPVAFTLVAGGKTILPDAANLGLFIYVMVLQHICWQILFIILAREPIRYRPMMLLASFVEALTSLNPIWLFFFGVKYWIPIVVVYLAFALLFIVAFWWTGRESKWRRVQP